jgi:peptide/nickel transport system substrate-binding protein
MYDPDKAKFLWKKAGSPSFDLQVSEGAFSGCTDAGVLFQESLRTAGTT